MYVTLMYTGREGGGGYMYVKLMYTGSEGQYNADMMLGNQYGQLMIRSTKICNYINLYIYFQV